MLAIEREPIYKNRYMLGALAIVAGFVVTFGAIRILNPADTSPNQSAQTKSDRRAASLIPVKASKSETSSESDKKDASTSSSNDVSIQGTSTTSSQWLSPSTTSSSSSPSATATPTQSTTTAQSTTSPTSTSSPTSSTTSSEPIQPAPDPNCIDILLKVCY